LKPSRGIVALAMTIAVAVQGCGAESSEAPQASDRPRSDRLVDFSKKPPYVNALDLDPQDGRLLLTTNKGFWKIDPEKDRVEQVRGTVTAGRDSSPVGTFLELKVTGPGKLVGSGHPDDPKALPNFLGYMESDDGGKTWRVISRLGDADLHKIVLLHGRMYAFDAVLGTMLFSEDGGRTFTEEFTPRGLIIDFEVDPRTPTGSSPPPRSSCSAPRTAARAGARSSAPRAPGCRGPRPARSTAPSATARSAAPATAA
jgi:hypothetical protein